MRRILIALLACFGLTTPVAIASAMPASASPHSVQTVACNSGFVCIYKGDIWDGSSNHPKVYNLYYYGTYNVQNLVGEYTVVNCQTGGARVQGWTGYNATGSVAWDIGNNCSTGLWTDLTPTNSVRLYA
ncbi:hypothetical protein [Streptomyces sp. NPDC001286]